MRRFTITMAIITALAACTSSAPSDGPGQDPGVSGDGTGAAAAADVNAYGVPYPTDNIGMAARSGARAGNRIANFKFLGYRNGDTSTGLVPIALADFFDPETRTFKLIHIQAVGTWCEYCRAETDVLPPLIPKLAARKVVWLMSVAEGPTPGTPATKRDLDQWIAQYKLPLAHMLDSGNRNLGVFYDAAAFPWNATIDPRTMELLQMGVGALTTEKEVLSSVDGWLARIDRGEL